MLLRSIFMVGCLMLSMTAYGAEYIVKTKGGESVRAFNLSGLAIQDYHDVGQIYKVEISDEAEVDVLAKLQADPNVQYVVKNFALKAFYAPASTEALKEQWANVKVNAEKAWALAGNRGSRQITIAVIDTGIDYNHESLKPNMVPGYDFKGNDSDPMDETSAQNPGHGTHCAGSLGSTGLVDGGVIGLSPEVSIMPIRFLGADGSGDLMAGIKSIDFAIEKKAHVISASWGAAVAASQATPLIEAVQRADDAGVIFVAAAANDGKNNDTRDVFPANAGTKNMISVAASGSSDEKPSWSNYGTAKVDLAAPGLNIMSTLPQNKYGNLSGTSMATPLVSGLVALLKAQRPEMTGAQIRSLLQKTGAKVQIETACNCRVDAEAAMKELLAKSLVVVPNAETVKPNETIQFSVMNAQGALTYTVANTAVGSIDANGLFKATAEGQTTISVKDASGKTAETLAIHVKSGSSGGGGDETCPLGDPAMCELMCQILPDLPWCK